MINRIRNTMNERDKGFTLIELLTCIIIIGILAAVAIPVFLNQRKKAVEASIKSDIKNTAIALETISIDDPNGAVPTSGTSGYYSAARISASGLKPSPGNTLYLKGAPSIGFCIGGSNPNATAPGIFYWYDSTTGGLQKTPNTIPTTGVCSLPNTNTAGAAGAWLIIG